MENLEPKTRFEYFLNKIATNNSESSEQSGGSFVVHLTPKDPSKIAKKESEASFIADKTAKEIKEHIDRDGLVATLDSFSDEYGSIANVSFFYGYEITENGYSFNIGDGAFLFAKNELDYPETPEE